MTDPPPPRKVELTTLGSISTPAEKTKSAQKPTRAQRFNLKLTESTNESCPEFSYVELCRNAAELTLSAAHPDGLDPSDPFSAKDQAEHDSMIRLAKKFEDKYSTKKTEKRKRKDRVKDLVDLGDGYDENDSFVDNSEAYDEYIPCSMSTKYGGFYVNTGRLDLVQVSGAEEESVEEEMPIVKKHKRSKVLFAESSDDASSNDIGVTNLTGDAKLNRLKNGSVRKKTGKDRSISTSLGLGEKRRRKKVLSQKILGKKKTYTVSQLLSATSSTAMQATGRSAEFSPGKISTVTSIDRPINCSVTLSRVPIPQHSSTVDLAIDAVVSKGRIDDDVVIIPEDKPPTIQPECMPAELLDSMNAMSALARMVPDGSIRQFTPEVSELLVNIDRVCRPLSSGLRSLVFENLGKFFECGKDGVMKRLKKLSLTHQEEMLRGAMVKLKAAVDRVMPTLLEKYREGMTATDKLRQERTAAGGDGNDVGGAEDGSEDEEAENGGNEGGNEPEKQPKRIVNPRRRFEWTREVRELLCRVVALRMERYEMARIRNITPEDHLRLFLEAEIKPMWSPGWMQTRVLLKESRSAHARWTGGAGVFKTKKSLAVGALKSSNTTTSNNLPVPVTFNQPPLLVKYDTDVGNSAVDGSVRDSSTVSRPPNVKLTSGVNDAYGNLTDSDQNKKIASSLASVEMLKLASVSVSNNITDSSKHVGDKKLPNDKKNSTDKSLNPKNGCSSKSQVNWDLNVPVAHKKMSAPNDRQMSDIGSSDRNMAVSNKNATKAITQDPATWADLYSPQLLSSAGVEQFTNFCESIARQTTLGFDASGGSSTRKGSFSHNSGRAGVKSHDRAHHRTKSSGSETSSILQVDGRNATDVMQQFYAASTVPGGQSVSRYPSSFNGYPATAASRSENSGVPNSNQVNTKSTSSATSVHTQLRNLPQMSASLESNSALSKPSAVSAPPRRQSTEVEDIVQAQLALATEQRRMRAESIRNVPATSGGSGGCVTSTVVSSPVQPVGMWRTADLVSSNRSNGLPVVTGDRGGAWLSPAGVGYSGGLIGGCETVSPSHGSKASVSASPDYQQLISGIYTKP